VPEADPEQGGNHKGCEGLEPIVLSSGHGVDGSEGTWQEIRRRTVPKEPLASKRSTDIFPQTRRFRDPCGNASDKETTIGGVKAHLAIAFDPISGTTGGGSLLTAEGKGEPFTKNEALAVAVESKTLACSKRG